MHTFKIAVLVSTSLLAITAAKQYDSWNVLSKWQVEIQEPIQVPPAGQKLVPDADIWDIDLWHAYNNSEIIPALHDREKTVICYFNLGAVQPDDCDFQEWYDAKQWNGPWYSAANGGDKNDRYCEKYENFTSSTIFDRMKTRLDKAAKIGCDGVDPDNIDLSTINWGNGKEVTDDAIVEALKQFAAYAHSLTTTNGNPLMFGQKNGPRLAKDLWQHLDFAVLESCHKSPSFCSSFQPYLDANKPVIDIEYPKNLRNPKDKKNYCNLSRTNSGDDNDPICPKISGTPLANMSRIIKLDFNDYGLNGCTQYCDRDSKVVITPTDDSGDNICAYDFKSECKTNKELKDNCCCGPCPK
ncbi:hypothetical protein NLG97_g972 [Lecanicillium saksenae]|uniref:Uncharacterized protein n=1 Tax=Lecanicillium saksenae TaxID=468837 RepID=A0ACC1R6J3_9HYPO|nr:hypothetical protein NLG97_g972 [Lecanicillium saksenae]